ncbi:hypothetical protein FGIG_09662 [Fasciola gigantica]|uniref:Uncharacterized protein n=1 Tax=Fasciola gigantica TaxID=46835 RepID=A0A504YXL3_FASGI|nr:hypothetical protein FGIG_09662 [Fasciola gigantica]
MRDELRRLNPQLYGENSRRIRIYPLHSQLATSSQRGLFEFLWETFLILLIWIVSIFQWHHSVTIEDVVHVIDCGRIKIVKYDSTRNTYSVAPVLVSKAKGAQQRGPAGR